MNLFISSFKKTLPAIAIAILLLYVVREFIYTGIRKNKIGEYDKLNTTFVKENNFDVLFVGSSRTESHIIPTIIDSICNTNSYNIGMDGASFPFAVGIFRAYLENSKPPRVVIFNVDLHSYSLKKIVINRFPRYFPYLKNKELNTICVHLDERFPYFRYLPFYSMPYLNDTYLNASMRGYLDKPSDFDRSYIKGYVPIPKELHQEVEKRNYKIFPSLPQPNTYESFDSAMAICSRINAKLIFIISPMYCKGAAAVSNITSLKKSFLDRKRPENVSFIDYSSDTLCFNSDYFADPYHLNIPGARLFSHKLAIDIKQYTQGKNVR